MHLLISLRKYYIAQSRSALHTIYTPLWTWHSMLLHHCIMTYFYRTFVTIVTLARLKYKLPDDGHRAKHVGVF